MTDTNQPSQPSQPGQRRQMKRIGDVLPAVAADLGIDRELHLARQMSAWQRIVEERVPRAAGATTMLALQPPALVVSATSPIVAQELRLRQTELLDAFAQAPDGQKLIELRIVVRAGRPAKP